MKKMITHEKVRYNVQITYSILSDKYKDKDSKQSIKIYEQEVLDYITRQEKKEKLLKLYQEKEKLQDERSIIHINYLDFEKHYLTISIRYLKSKIKTLEEELQ